MADTYCYPSCPGDFIIGLCECAARGKVPVLTPSADLPACRDDDPAQAATLAACYPDPPEYQHPDGDPQ